MARLCSHCSLPVVHLRSPAHPLCHPLRLNSRSNYCGIHSRFIPYINPSLLSVLFQISTSLVRARSSQRYFNRSLPFCDIEPVIERNERVNLAAFSHTVANLAEVEDGGEYAPADCRPRFSVAIIVPYRDREEHLEVFLRVFHNYLRRQKLHYRIFVVEQNDANPFNRGKLFNIGAKYAAKFGFPCFVLHDVDLLPLNMGNIFACSASPRHMSASLDSFRFNLPYSELFGGAVAILEQTYKVTIFWLSRDRDKISFQSYISAWAL